MTGETIRRLAPGVGLIIVTSVILLFSDKAPRGIEQGEGQTAGWKLNLVRYNDSPAMEAATEGVIEGLQSSGLVEGRDYTLQVQSAQGDIATLSLIMSSIKSQGSDLVIVLSTPALQAAVKQFSQTPVVFTVVADGVVAGAGTSESEHRPNVTGITTLGAFDQMPPLLKQCLPGVKRVGTLFTPSEANSVYNKDVLEKHLNAAGIELLAVPVNSSGEVTDAANAMCSRDIDAVCQSLDNLTSASFATIGNIANQAKLPLFGFVSEQAEKGGVLVLARDYYDAGLEGAKLVARVIRGADPAEIPFTNMQQVRLIVNMKQANAMGIQVPQAILQQADEVIR